MRKKYFGRFWMRIFVLFGVVYLYFSSPESFDVLEKEMFFKKLSILHILWGIWILDMIAKLFPIPGTLALGSLKQIKRYYQPTNKSVDKKKTEEYHRINNQRALLVFGVWSILGAVIGIVWKMGILGYSELFLVSVVFYVCDLICVLMWCPFRVWFLKNRCCTTCRIFNWDHFMMFTPMFFVNSFYANSLTYSAVILLLIWEYRVYRYPERFFEQTNEALKCRNCTDHLCGRYPASGK